jgi:hypothetical protein
MVRCGSTAMLLASFLPPHSGIDFISNAWQHLDHNWPLDPQKKPGNVVESSPPRRRTAEIEAFVERSTNSNCALAAYSSDVDQGSWMMPISVPAIPIKVGAQRRWRA